MSTPLYFREDVRLEPLVNSWYAWPLLISPVTVALITKNLHLRIMESFIKAPQVHKSAARNPLMRGGPFMDYDGDSGQIQQLIRSTQQRLAPLIRLAEQIKQFDAELRRDAQGGSLVEYYARIPQELKGFVELVYDLHNRPAMRFIEGLLYTSRYYDPSLQAIAISAIKNDDRPFVLSTPRIFNDGELGLHIPFRSALIDRMIAMRTSPADRTLVDQLVDEHLDGTAGQKDRFVQLFTPTPPPQPSEEATFRGPGVRVRYFGHATVLVESAEVSILTDPVVSYPVANGIPRYSYRDLPARIDYVLLTHAHQDHVMLETLLQLRGRIGKCVVPKSAGVIQDPSLKMMLNTLGFQNVVELDEMETLDITEGRITGLPFLGEHGDLHIRSKLAFHVRLKDRTLLFAADSNNVADELYDHIHQAVGNIDHLFIGMECDGAPVSWLYGPLFPGTLERRSDQSRRLNGSNCERAMGIVRRAKPKSAYVYAMGQEPWLKHISSIAYTEKSVPIVESDKLVAQCKGLGIASERLFGRKHLMF